MFVSTSLAAQKCPSEAAGGKRQVGHCNTNLEILILNRTAEHGSTDNSKCSFYLLLREKIFNTGSKQLFPTLSERSYWWNFHHNFFFFFCFQTLLLNLNRKGPFQPTLSMKTTAFQKTAMTETHWGELRLYIYPLSIDLT